jgi:sterol desaturase/sphingolipid hydroxylase (fatty acid hydroxylase superfamily)
LVIGYKRWLEQRYLLDRMSLQDLIKAYFTYPAIQAYLLLLAVSAATAAVLAEEAFGPFLAVALSALAYPLIEYLLHRFLLHARWLYKSALTAALWKRIHFDHHQHPNDLAVLFGALHTTLPVILLVTIPIGWLAGGPAGIAAAMAAGFAIISFYEFCHCIQHLSYKPKSRYLLRIRRLHLAHHFHNEQGNFGITGSLWDHVFGSYYEKPSDVPRSETARNLGYTEDERLRYPWVAELSETPPDGALAEQ